MDLISDEEWEGMLWLEASPPHALESTSTLLLNMQHSSPAVRRLLRALIVYFASFDKPEKKKKKKKKKLEQAHRYGNT